jgi:hypothetical protein
MIALAIRREQSLTRMVKPNSARHPLVQVAVTRGELVAKDEQDEEIHLIGAAGIRGMSFWLDVGSVVVQNVEDKVAS